MVLKKNSIPDSWIPHWISLEKTISHSSLRDSCDIVFLVKFNVEFPRHPLNFPIELYWESHRAYAMALYVKCGLKVLQITLKSITCLFMKFIVSWFILLSKCINIICVYKYCSFNQKASITWRDSCVLKKWRLYLGHPKSESWQTYEDNILANTRFVQSLWITLFLTYFMT